jgi:hypothetical protein
MRFLKIILFILLLLPFVYADCIWYDTAETGLLNNSMQGQYNWSFQGGSGSASYNATGAINGTKSIRVETMTYLNHSGNPANLFKNGTIIEMWWNSTGAAASNSQGLELQAPDDTRMMALGMNWGGSTTTIYYNNGAWASTGILWSQKAHKFTINITTAGIVLYVDDIKVGNRTDWSISKLVLQSSGNVGHFDNVQFYNGTTDCLNVAETPADTPILDILAKNDTGSFKSTFNSINENFYFLLNYSNSSGSTYTTGVCGLNISMANDFYFANSSGASLTTNSIIVNVTMNYTNVKYDNPSFRACYPKTIGASLNATVSCGTAVYYRIIPDTDIPSCSAVSELE